MVAVLLNATCFNAQAAESSTPQGSPRVGQKASPSRFGIMSAEVRETVANQMTEIAQLKVKVQDLLDKYQEANTALGSCKSELDDLREHALDMSGEYAKADQEILEINEAKLVQERANTELRRVNDDLLRQLSDVKLELEQAHQKLIEEKALVLAEKKLVIDVRRELDHANTLNDSLNEELREEKVLVVELQKLEIVLRQQAELIVSLQEKLNEAQMLLKSQDKQIDDLKVQVKDQQDLLDRSAMLASADTSFAGGNLFDDLGGHPDVEAQQERAAQTEGMFAGFRQKISKLLEQPVMEEEGLQLDQKIALLSQAKAAKEADLLRLQPGTSSSFSVRQGYRSSIVSRSTVGFDLAGSELLLAGAAVGSIKILYDARQTRQQVEALGKEILELDTELQKVEQQKRLYEENMRLRLGLQGLLSQ